MTITIEHIGFCLTETTNKTSADKEFMADKMEVHYLAFQGQNHEIRGMIELPYNDHVYLPEIIRQIRIQLKY